MLSNHVYHTDLSNQEDKLNTSNLCAFLFPELRTPQSSFSVHEAFGLHLTISAAVVSPASTEEEPLGHVSPMQADWKALCISVPNAMRFPGRLALMNHFSVCILFINIDNFPLHHHQTANCSKIDKFSRTFLPRQTCVLNLVLGRLHL